jgi:hypothetical protein
MLSQYSSRLSPADHFHPWAIGRYVDASHIIMAIYLNSLKASWFILLQSGQVSMWVNQVDGLYETQIEMKSLGIMSRSIADMENPSNERQRSCQTGTLTGDYTAAPGPYTVTRRHMIRGFRSFYPHLSGDDWPVLSGMHPVRAQPTGTPNIYHATTEATEAWTRPLDRTTQTTQPQPDPWILRKRRAVKVSAER